MFSLFMFRKKEKKNRAKKQYQTALYQNRAAQTALPRLIEDFWGRLKFPLKVSVLKFLDSTVFRDFNLLLRICSIRVWRSVKWNTPTSEDLRQQKWRWNSTAAGSIHARGSNCKTWSSLIRIELRNLLVKMFKDLRPDWSIHQVVCELKFLILVWAPPFIDLPRPIQINK